MKLAKQSIILVLVFLTSCTSNTKKQRTSQFNYKTKVIDYGTFTIVVPENWTNQGVVVEDSYVGNIKITENSFVHFDLGMYSNNLDEDDNEEYYKVENGKVYVPEKSSTRNNAKWIFFGNADSSILKKVRRNNVKWETIDNLKSKLVSPRKIENGLTGIYIDSLWEENGGKIKFQLSSYNPKSEQQRQLLNAIHSLHFHKGVPMRFVFKD